jgi:hypothetical protein
LNFDFEEKATIFTKGEKMLRFLLAKKHWMWTTISKKMTMAPP